jgi:hypothetical protein
MHNKAEDLKGKANNTKESCGIKGVKESTHRDMGGRDND